MKNIPKRTIKDTVFKDLFSDKHNLLKLYQVLHPEDTEASVDSLKNITLESILTDSIYNDLGFQVNDRLIVLVEAQSTWSYKILEKYLKGREKEVKDIMGELFNQERATELYGKEMAKEAAKEAEYKKSLEIAKKLLKKCMSIDDVAEATGLPIEEVKALSMNLCA